MPVVASPADTGQRTHPFDPHLIALPHDLRVDHREDVVPPGSPFFRRCSLTCRKAARKKSSSNCCWPIFRSNSSIRRCPVSADAGGDGADSSSKNRAASNGRPIGCNAPAPPDCNLPRQIYSNFRSTPSSLASAVIFPVSSIRATARSLNSRGHRVLGLGLLFVFDTLVLLAKQCVLFPCLSLGVHSTASPCNLWLNLLLCVICVILAFVPFARTAPDLANYGAAKRANDAASTA